MSRRGGKTRSNRHPPSPGPKRCSPVAVSRRADAGSCLPSQELKKIASTTRKRGGSGPKTSLGLNSVNTTALAKELGCSADDGRCIVQRSLLSHQEKKALLDTYFRPKQPDGWKADPDQWLTSEDIEKVMKQYQKAYPHFRFIGVVPIDFSAPDPYQPTHGQKPVTTTSTKLHPDQKCLNDQFCRVDLAAEKAAGRTLLGAVFNLDPHTKGGSHWVALAIDLKRDCVYFFDSYGMPPPEQVARFMRYLTLQNPKLKLQTNGRPFQKSNTECGMYSLYFLIRMIAGANFKKFCKQPISDKWMYAFRNVLFDPDAQES
jgi:hypothetical protein